MSLVLYLLKIGDAVHGPYTGHQVLSYFDAGQIDDNTKIAVAPDEAKTLNTSDSQTLGKSNLLKRFSELRATADNPSLYYLSQILEEQEKQTNLLHTLRWSVAGIGIALAAILLISGHR